MVPGKGSCQGADADFFVDSQDRLAEAEGDGRQELEQLVQGFLFRKASAGGRGTGRIQSRALLGIRMFLGIQDPDPDPLFRDTEPYPDPSLFS